MAIKDQCFNCNKYNAPADKCKLTGTTPVCDHRSCQNYSPKNSPTSSKKKTAANHQIQNERISKILILVAGFISIAGCFLLGFGLGYAIWLSVLICLVVIALVFVLLPKANFPISVVFLIISLLFAGYGTLKTVERVNNREEVDFLIAKRTDTEEAYRKYLSSFPATNHNQECCDSIEARQLDKIIDASPYMFTSHRYFINDCNSTEIKLRAIKALDIVYPKVMYGENDIKFEFMQYYNEIYPEGNHHDEFIENIANEIDDRAYRDALEAGTIKAYNKYLRDYPSGRNRDAMLEKIKVAEEEMEMKAYNDAVDTYTYESLTKYLREYPNGKHADYIKQQLSELRIKQENEKYANNYLSTGSQPYANRYGRNKNSGNCAISVNATGSTDVVVVVKYNNSNGSVAGHAYIHKGGKYTIHLHPGTYQVFFYYGNGWNPNKKLANGLTGGFTSNEQYGKDNPLSLSYQVYDDYISYDQIEYSLQATVGGNFSMKNSNANDVF